MPANIFIDTNLWVYLYAKNPPEKYGQIRQLVTDQFEGTILSTQILGELYHVLTRKDLTTSAKAQTIVVEMATSFPVLDIDTSKVLQALDISTRLQYSYWDSLVIATALLADCQILYSEDMHHQQIVDEKLHILNPFE
jgi:predicted nucleic acid-binding protein